MPLRRTADIQREQAEADALWRGLTEELSGGFISLTDRQTMVTAAMPTPLLRGNTSFFRHTPHYRTALDIAALAHDRTGEAVTLTCAAGSVGAEAHTLAFRAVERGYENWLRIRTLDLSPRFTAIAAAGIYPHQMLPNNMGYMAVGSDLFVEDFGDSYVRVSPRFKKMVEVLPAQSILRLASNGVQSDVTISMKTLIYLKKQKDEAARNLALSTRFAIVTDGDVDIFWPELKTRGFTRTMDESHCYVRWPKSAMT